MGTDEACMAWISSTSISMDTLNFVIGLHEALGVEVPEVDYSKLATLDGGADYLAGRLPVAGRVT